MEKLTKRELEILPFICLTQKEIAQHFKISISTACVHLSNLMSKFLVNNRTQLLTEALRQDMIKLEDVIVRLK